MKTSGVYIFLKTILYNLLQRYPLRKLCDRVIHQNRPTVAQNQHKCEVNECLNFLKFLKMFNRQLVTSQWCDAVPGCGTIAIRWLRTHQERTRIIDVVDFVIPILKMWLHFMASEN